MIEGVAADRTSFLLALGLGGLLALFLALQPPLQVGAGFLAVGVALLAFVNRRAALYLIVPAIAVSPEMPVLGLSVRLEDLLMVPLTVGWLAQLCVSKERLRTPVDRVLIAYLAVALVATLWGGYLGTAHLATLNKYVSAPFHLLKRFEFAFLFFIIVGTLDTPTEVQRFTYVLMASLVALSGFALVEFLSNHHIALAPAGAPVHEPGLASMINVALALSLLRVARPPAKVLLSAIILFSVAVLPLTLGRNFIATTGLLLLYVGLFQQRWILAFLPVPWLIGAYLYPQHVIERVLTFEQAFAPDITGFHTQGAALISRVVSPGQYSLLALGYSPLVGFGLGSIPLGSMDSEYATQVFYTGLVGLAVFAILGARLFRLAREAVRAARDPLHVGLARGFQLVLAAYAIHSIFSPSISATRGGEIFFVVAGLLGVLHRSLTQAPVEALRGASGSGRSEAA
jgi:hypothetical protein